MQQNFNPTTVTQGSPITPYVFPFTQDDAAKVIRAGLDLGADFIDIYMEYQSTSSLGFEEQIVKSASNGISIGVGLRALRGEQTGYAFTEDLTLESMLHAVRVAASISSDKNARIQAQALREAQKRDLYSIQEIPSTLPLSTKLKYIQEADASARAVSDKIIHVGCSFYDELRMLEYYNSDGVHWTDTQPVFVFSVNTIAQDGDQRQTGRASGGGRIGLEYFDTVRSAGVIAKEAADLAMLNLTAKEAPAGPMTVVLGPADSGVLLHEAVGHGLEADFNRKNLSNYSNQIGQEVASPLCTIVDEGLFPHMRGSINVDDEGNTPSSTTLIENGKLVTYMNDRMSAEILGVKPTGNGRRESYASHPMPRMTNTYMRAGESDPNEILSSVKKGIYAKRFGGGQVDITKGDFVFTVEESYLIEDGKLTHPLKGVTLIGNGPDVMRKITMVGKDLKFTDGGWTCGKDGQSVPVGMGIPTVKVSEITVGGTKV